MSNERNQNQDQNRTPGQQSGGADRTNQQSQENRDGNRQPGSDRKDQNQVRKDQQGGGSKTGQQNQESGRDRQTGQNSGNTPQQSSSRDQR
jgi:hypothetical protein